jgi:hypothetical protein
LDKEDVYRCANGYRNPLGYLLKIVACGPDELKGYAFIQVRNWSEIYIYELAVMTPQNSPVIRGLGSLLLGVVAGIALQLGKEYVTANVRRASRGLRVQGYNSDCLVRHCQRYGLQVTPERGVLFKGTLTGGDDIWLKGKPKIILDKQALSHPSFISSSLLRINQSSPQQKAS